MQTIQPWRVVVKALILAFIVNTLFGLFNPSVEMLSLYNSLVRGRQRFPFEDSEYEKQGNTMMLYESYNAMFASHIINEPKPANEYRVVLVGDSSVWGYNLSAPETLSAQLNGLNLSTCNNKKIVAYNLAYVGTYLPRDLLTIDRSMKYKPDLVIWMVTLDTFVTSGPDYVKHELMPYANETLDLIEKYNLKLDTYGLRRDTPWDDTIWAQRSKLKKLAKFQMDALLWDATNVDFYLRTLPKMSIDAYPDPIHNLRDSYALKVSELPFDILSAGYKIAAPVPILVVNEPIYIATGKNSNIRYNSYYPRLAYNQYLIYLRQWMKKNNQPYVDLWNFVPAGQFEDTPFHMSAVAEAMVASRLASELVNLSCK